MKKTLCLGLLLLPHWALAALPDRFLPVSEGIYRSAQPVAADFDSLRDEAGIRTLVSLNDDPSAIEEEARNAAAHGMRFVSIPLSGFFAPSDENVNAALAELANRDNWPVLLHCQYGRDRTGLVTGLYRVEEEKWAPKKAFREMVDLGFRRLLVPLELYFRGRTGYRELPPVATPASATYRP